MVDNTDIHPRLTEQMVLVHTEKDGTNVYELAALGVGENFGSYLYRSMDIEEARNWLSGNWAPDESGIPWSTDHVYSYENYLKKERTVQLEVPAHDIIDRIKLAGAVPKYEGKTIGAETWGVGPKAEIGRSPSSDANKSLLELHDELSTQNIAHLPGKMPKSKLGKEGKKYQNSLFQAMFRDKLQQGRVVRRRIKP